MPEQQEFNDASHAMILGEMRGQLRELVHGQNNLSAKVDGLSREVITLTALAADMADLKMRLKVIEERNSQQRGAVNLVEWLVKNWPGMLGFVLLLAILLRAQGKL
jgi:Tfp pilus assembly protein PilN